MCLCLNDKSTVDIRKWRSPLKENYFLEMTSFAAALRLSWQNHQVPSLTVETIV